MNENLIIEIRKRISKDEQCEWNTDYNGFRMDKTHSQEEENKLITEHNKQVIDLFKDHLDSHLIKNTFDCWKGICYLTLNKELKNDEQVIIKEFPAWNTEDIIYWLINEGQKEIWNKIELETKEYVELEIPKEEVYRIITSQQRYDVLKRQKWKCNICNEQLKYRRSNSWEGEVAHIDHIHPYTKKETYVNGAKKINESINLQALCPDCNLKKGAKDVH